jgi:hypothetical protein
MGNRYVLQRFGLKLLLLGGFALLHSETDALLLLSGLLGLAAVLDAVLAIARGERLWSRTLTYWDEAAMTLATGTLIRLTVVV